MPVNKERIEFIQGLVNLCLLLAEQLCDCKLYKYQRTIADRLFFSLLIGDSEEITVETARQAGKSQVLACVAATAMVIFPVFAKMYPKDPIIKKFKNGIMIGVFGPVDLQSDNIFSRIEMMLTSEVAANFMRDPDINDYVRPSGVILRMVRNRSFCRKQTAHPKAKIESSTYHLVLLDEAQDADAVVVEKSIEPMTVAVGGTIVKVGTPAPYKSDFYEAIQRNRRRGRTHGKRNHFAFDWKHAARENPYYAASVKKAMRRHGEDSDFFQMSYCLKWMLDRGMFITEEMLDALSDKKMDRIPSWSRSAVVMGVDPARTHDSTICTVVWVDWDHPDEFGLYYHRVLDWLELHGEDWESQYKEITAFASRYHVMKIGVDSQGMGGPVAERLQVLMPHIEVVPLKSDPNDQHLRWTNAVQIIQRRLVGWPGSRAVRRSREGRRFRQQMIDAEKEYKNKYLTVHAPDNDKNAHDDYVDSLAIALMMTQEFGQDNEVEQWSTNPLMERGMGVLR